MKFNLLIAAVALSSIDYAEAFSLRDLLPGTRS